MPEILRARHQVACSRARHSAGKASSRMHVQALISVPTANAMIASPTPCHAPRRFTPPQPVLRVGQNQCRQIPADLTPFSMQLDPGIRSSMVQPKLLPPPLLLPHNSTPHQCPERRSRGVGLEAIHKGTGSPGISHTTRHAPTHISHPAPLPLQLLLTNLSPARF